MSKHEVDSRHHAAHPPTNVKPNTAANQKPGAYTPPTPEKAAISPNPNPSLGEVGVDTMNARRPGSRRQDAEDVSNPESPNYNPDDPNYDPSLDSSGEGDEDRRDDPTIHIS